MNYQTNPDTFCAKEITCELARIETFIQESNLADIDPAEINQILEQLHTYINGNHALGCEISLKIRELIRNLETKQLELSKSNRKTHSKALSTAGIAFLLITVIYFVLSNSGEFSKAEINNAVTQLANALGIDQIATPNISYLITAYISQHNLNESSWLDGFNSFISTSQTIDGSISIQFPASITQDIYIKGIALPLAQSGNNQYYALTISPDMPISMLQAQLQSLLGSNFALNLENEDSELVITTSINGVDRNLVRFIVEGDLIKGIIIPPNFQTQEPLKELLFNQLTSSQTINANNG